MMRVVNPCFDVVIDDDNNGSVVMETKLGRILSNSFEFRNFEF